MNIVVSCDVQGYLRSVGLHETSHYGLLCCVRYCICGRVKGFVPRNFIERINACVPVSCHIDTEITKYSTQPMLNFISTNILWTRLRACGFVDQTKPSCILKLMYPRGLDHVDFVFLSPSQIFKILVVRTRAANRRHIIITQKGLKAVCDLDYWI